MRNLFYVNTSPFQFRVRPDSSKGEHGKVLSKKTFSSDLQSVQNWEASTGGGTAVTSTEANKSSVQFSDLFWQSDQLTRVLSSPLWPDDKKSIFIPWLYATAQLHLQAWWLLKYLAGWGRGGGGGGFWLLCSLSFCYSLLFTADFFPVSHMHLSRLSILHKNNRCVQQPGLF